MKGWYGDRYAHKLASKGVKTKMNSYGETAINNPYFILDKHDIPNIVEYMTNSKYWEEKRDLKSKIIWIPVERYEEAIEYGFKMDNTISGRKPFGYPIRERISEVHLEKIKDILKEQPVAMPFISYKMHDKFKKPNINDIQFDQEGHHRVVASGELGEPMIPVFVIYPIGDWQDYAKRFMTPYIKEAIGI